MWEEFKYVDASRHLTGGSSTKWERILISDVANYVAGHKDAEAYFNTVQRFLGSQPEDREEHYSDFFIDLDDEKREESRADAQKIVKYFLANYDVEPKIWFSGNKGFHLIVPGELFDARPNPDLTYFWREVALDLKNVLTLRTLDESVYSKRRMWRVDNTRHPKSDLYKIRLDSSELDKGIESITVLAEKPRDIDWENNEVIPNKVASKRFRQASQKFLEHHVLSHDENLKYNFRVGHPPCIQFLLDNGLASKGTKNRADMAMAGYLKSSGMPIESAISFMSDWAKSIPDGLTNIKSPDARAVQSRLVLRTAYSSSQYRFSCGSIKSCGVDVDCSGCKVVVKEAQKVALSDYALSDNRGKPIAIEADVIGKASREMIYPKKAIGFCGGFDPTSKQCLRCNLRHYIDADNPVQQKREIMFDAANPLTAELLGMSYQSLAHKIKRLFGIHERCYDFQWEAEWGNAQVIHLASRISNEFKVENKIMRFEAYYLGHDIDLNRSYELTGYVWSHSRTMEAIFLTEELRPLQSTLSTFTIPDEAKRDLNIFKPTDNQSPLDKVKDIHQSFINDFAFVFGRDELFMAVDLVYHSVRWIPFQKRTIKGWLDALILGDTGQGKSYVAELMMKHYDLGTMAAGETASRTGLLYTIQMIQGEEAWVSFGLLPRANGYLVVVDEIHGMPAADFREFTLVRSKGVVDVKRAAWGVAAAETRLISIANARPGKSLGSYGYAVMAIKDIPCFQALEDIRRFDFAVGVRAGDVSDDTINTDVRDIDSNGNPYTAELCKNLLLWIWTRKPENVIVDGETETLILKLAKEVSSQYVPNIPLVEAADIRNKLCRIATAFAGRTYSTIDGENLLVLPEHAQAASDTLEEFYSSEGLDYTGYSEEMSGLDIDEDRMVELRKEFKAKYPAWERIARWFILVNDFNKTHASTSLPVEKSEIDPMLAFLIDCRFLDTARRGFIKTPKGRDFFKGMLYDESEVFDEEGEL